MGLLQRLFNFANGTTANADQVDAEFDQLVAAVNQHTNDIANGDLATMNFFKGLGFGSTTYDVTGQDLNGIDLTGFYYGKNLISAPVGYTEGYIINIKKSATQRKQIFSDYNSSRVFMRTQFFGNWVPSGAWQEIFTSDGNQTVLWTGAAYPGSSTTITPSKKLSECKNGWKILWSDYDSGTSTANDFDFTYSEVLKYSGANLSGKTHIFAVPNFASDTSNQIAVKKLVIYDNKIVGNDDNSSGTTSANDAVIRAIIEF